MQLSPFVYRQDIKSENTVCLLNVITLKKFFCSESLYSEIMKNIKESHKNPLIEKLIQENLITEKEIDKKKIFQKIADHFPKSPEILSSYLFLTDECNFRCSYCFEKKPQTGSGKIINKEQADNIIKVIKRNAAKSRPYQIFFYGGESLLYSEIMFHIVEKLKNVKYIEFKFALNTNGSLITQELAKKLKQNNFVVCVSLDGWKEINDKARKFTDNNGTYYDTLKGILTLQKEGVETSISCTISSHNFMLMPEIVEFIARLGIKNMGFNLLIGKPSGLDNLNPETLAFYFFEAFKKAKSLGITEERIGQRRYAHFLKEVPRLNDCVGCGEQICFYPDGRVGTCHAFYPSKHFSINLPENPEDFIASKNEIWIEWCKRSPFNMQECIDCEAIALCGGGCPYNSFVKEGSIWARDKFFCVFMKKILRYMILYYYYEEVLKTKIERISIQDLSGFVSFVEDLKKDTNAELFSIGKVTDSLSWGISGVNMNNSNDGIFLIAKEKEKIIGFCNLFRKDDKYECGIGLLHKYRNKGVGTRLIERLLLEAKNLKVKEVYAGVKKANINSIDFFKFNNFKVVEERENSLLLRRFV